MNDECYVNPETGRSGNAVLWDCIRMCMTFTMDIKQYLIICASHCRFHRRISSSSKSTQPLFLKGIPGMSQSQSHLQRWPWL